MTSHDAVLKFWEWYDKARGEVSTREVERRARVGYGLIGNAYQKRITYDVAIAIARGLDKPEVLVLRQAKLLRPTNEDTEEERLEVLEAGRRLTAEERRQWLEYADFLLQQRRKSKESGGTPGSPSVPPARSENA